MSNTRIIVKNLPQRLSQDGFAKHFSTHGEVTDVRLVTNKKTGQSRRFGFIGYKTAKDAEEAIKWWNNTFVGMSKVEVSWARESGDADMPKAWSAHTPGTTAYNIAHAPPAAATEDGSKKRKRDDEPAHDASHIAKLRALEEANDPKLKEFMDVMGGTKGRRTWDNKDSALEFAMQNQDTVAVAEPQMMKLVEGKDDDEYDELPPKQAHQDVVSELPLAEEISVDVKEGTEESAPAAQPEGMSDMDWLRSRTNRLLDLDEEDTSMPPVRPPAATAVVREVASNPSGSETAPDVAEPQDEEAEVHGAAAEEEILEQIQSTSRLFLRNLPFTATEDDLRALFGQFGEVEEAHIPIDKLTNSAKGYAYILFTAPSSAVTAYKALDRQHFQGRRLHILPAQAKREQHKLDDFAISKLPLKKQKELRRKAAANKEQWSWNSMYMNQDAVISSIADRFGVSKSEVLDPTSSNAAVRQALAETHVIQETKEYLKSEGVDLDSFNKKERSDKVLLVKNFPYGTTVEELSKLFSDFGDLGRIILPPAGTIAIVEFLQPVDARTAFARLAYRRFKEAIMYLEKAPRGVFDGEKAAAAAVTASGPVPVDAKSTADEVMAANPVDVDAMDSATLFIKNLSFKTETAGLIELFKPLNGFLSARVKTKPDPKRPGQTLSMGFGFVEFASKSTAMAAMNAMQDVTLDGHKLQIKVSNKGVDAAAERKAGDQAKKAAAASTKIIIKNLPFEATKRDVRELFGAYGQLRTVRVPKKFDNSARGFAFAEFVTTREAENAMAALRDTHLLGRHLVLQYAAKEAETGEEEVERAQEKVRKQIKLDEHAKARGAGGKRRVEMEEPEEF
ncbi:Multiple RNA-binding domain-containing protein 1 [Saitoella coloradoensis]